MEQLNNTTFNLGFLGDVPLLKREELDRLDIKYDFQVDIFDLSKPEDVEKYKAILNDIAAGKSILRKEDIQFVNGNWKVLLLWAKIFIKERKNNG